MAKRMRLLLSDPCSAQLLQAEQWLEADDKRCNSHAFQINLSHGKVFGMHNCWKQIKRHPTSSTIIQPKKSRDFCEARNDHCKEVCDSYQQRGEIRAQRPAQRVHGSRLDRNPVQLAVKEKGPVSSGRGLKLATFCCKSNSLRLDHLKRHSSKPHAMSACSCLPMPTLEHYSCNFLLWLWL